MNREGSMWLAPSASSPDHGVITAAPIQVRADRQTLLMMSLWLFIGVVAAYDVYLSIKYQEVLQYQELNPLGRWLLKLDGGSVAVFMGCKFLGTLVVLGVIQLLYFYRRHLGLTVATAMACVQVAVGTFLLFG